MIPEELRQRLFKDSTLTLTLKVVPKASKNEVVGLQEDGSMKVKVTAAPERGRANAAVSALLAEVFGVPKRNIEIVRGDTSTSKLVRITAGSRHPQP